MYGVREQRQRQREVGAQGRVLRGQLFWSVVLECQRVRVLECKVLRANRVGQFVSVVLEYAVVVLESKDRWVSDVMVVIMVNDQGSVVVVAVVLQGKRQGEAERITTKIVFRVVSGACNARLRSIGQRVGRSNAQTNICWC